MQISTKDIHTALRPAIARTLCGYVHRRRREAAIRSSSHCVLLVLLWILAWGIADRFLALHAIFRLGLLITLTAIVIAMCGSKLITLFRKQFDWRDAARQVESRD